MALGSVRRWASLVAISAAVAVAASGGASSGAATVLPVVTVTPETNLTDHQLVTVSGSGYAPGSSVYISQCFAHPTASFYEVCDYATSRYETVSTNGTFTAANMALERRQIIYGFFGRQVVD